jgi:nucleosome binding factor SPN SPT16 subunit
MYKLACFLFSDYPPFMLNGAHLYVCLCIFCSNDDRLDYGVIISTFGVRYRYYCSSIIRTMLVQPTEVSKIYLLEQVKLKDAIKSVM